MNIRKIIKEEIDDFKWMEEINYLSYDYLKGKALEFDPSIRDGKYLNHVLDILEGLGFRTNSDVRSLLNYGDEEEIVGLFLDGNEVIWTGDIFEGYQEHIDDYSNGPVVILNGRSLIPAE